MASYLSYFTSNSSAQSQQVRPSTPSSTSTWSSAFSSRLASLRKALTKDSEEDDPDNEDCSHISNVLRAYYTEKGRPFPDWLPPDPKKPVPATVQSTGQFGQYGNLYGGYGSSQYTSQPSHGRGGSGGRGGLSDLWDSPSTQAPPVAAGPQSFRGAASRPAAQLLRSHDSGSSGGSVPGTGSYTSPTSSTSRPLPSQRAGSYQGTANANATALGSKDRLRARLQGRERIDAPLRSNDGQHSYGDATGLGGQTSSSNTPPYVSASEPWSNGGQNFDMGSNYSMPSANAQYTNSSRYRPGGPR